MGRRAAGADVLDPSADGRYHSRRPVPRPRGGGRQGGADGGRVTCGRHPAFRVMMAAAMSAQDPAPHASPDPADGAAPTWRKSVVRDYFESICIAVVFA